MNNPNQPDFSVLFLAHAWKTYREIVLRDVTNPVQLKETKQGFYAGAQSVLTTMLALADLPDDVGEIVMGHLCYETQEFAMNIGKPDEPLVPNIFVPPDAH